MFDAERFLSGDSAYVDEIVRDNSAAVFIVCQSYARDYDHAQDLIQDTWTAVCSKAHTFKGSSSLKSWLHRIATNVCVSERRSSVARGDAVGRYRIEVNGNDGWEEVDPLYDSAERVRHRAIHQALALLTDGEREAITLRVLQGRSPQEVAAIMGVATSTVRSHVRHGMKHLQEIADNPDGDLWGYRPGS